MAEAKKTTAAKTKKAEKPVEKVPEAVAENTAADLNKETATAEEATKKTAKAGKRSAKAIAEVEEKQAKEERKARAHEVSEDEKSKPKIAQKPPRSKLERKSKGFRKVAELIEKDTAYSPREAAALATKTNPVKFDATVELHVRLAVDPRQADQNIRDIVVLPAGTGKVLRVAVVADADGVTAAKKAGADLAGGDEFLQELDKGVINFDILIATPAFMPKLGKYARILGPKGLMPNPKSGTVTTDVAKGVADAKAGRVEYRVDTTGIVHVGIGKVSFGAEKVLENLQAVLNSIKQNKPTGIKGSYIRSVYVTTSMGPSIRINSAEV